MKRRALIIGASFPTVSENYLAGVNIDLDSYRNFLISPTGGAWIENEELFILKNATKDNIKSMIKKLTDQKPDYSFVTFSGHGGADSPTQNYINTHDDQKMTVEELWINAPKRMLIVDACRKQAKFKVLMEAARKAVAMDSFSDPTARKILARKLFAEALEDSPLEYCMAYSCSYNETAADRGDIGGLFTSTLIRNSYEWAQNRRSEYRTIQKTMDAVKPLVSAAREDAKKQTPIFSRDRNIGNTYPFVIGA